MKYDDPEYQIAKREIRDKVQWSYFWAATAGITAVASVVLGVGMLTPLIAPSAQALIGFGITALGGIGASIQSFSYDREVAALHDKLEVSLSKDEQPVQSQELGTAIKELSSEIHQLRSEAPGRSDGKRWADVVQMQQEAALQTER